MKMTKYSTRDMAIHAAADLTKSLQTPRPESPFQVWDAQLNAIRELSHTFGAETKIPKKYAFTTPPRIANEEKD